MLIPCLRARAGALGIAFILEDAGLPHIQQGGRNKHEHICDALELFAAPRRRNKRPQNRRRGKPIPRPRSGGYFFSSTALVSSGFFGSTGFASERAGAV